MGTGGTLTGVSRHIKHTRGKAITTVAVEPSDSPLITQTRNGEALTHAPHKIQGTGAGLLPANLGLSLVDQVETVTNEEAMAHRLMQEEGILAGISCGAAVAAAIRVGQQPAHRGKNIVVILPDSAERYLSTALFEGRFGEQETVQSCRFWAARARSVPLAGSLVFLASAGQPVIRRCKAGRAGDGAASETGDGIRSLPMRARPALLGWPAVAGAGAGVPELGGVSGRQPRRGC